MQRTTDKMLQSRDRDISGSPIHNTDCAEKQLQRLLTLKACLKVADDGAEAGRDFSTTGCAMVQRTARDLPLPSARTCVMERVEGGASLVPDNQCGADNAMAPCLTDHARESVVVNV